jgi:hypothetical protein
MATRQGFQPAVVVVETAAGSAVTAQLELKSAAAPGHIRTSCSVPDVRLTVDDVSMGTVFGTMVVVAPAGERAVSFERAGYRSAPVRVTVGAATDAVPSVACQLAFDPEFPVAERGRLELFPLESSTSLKQANVGIDGAPWRFGWLPPGKHQVNITLAGFRPWQQLVELERGSTTVVSVALEATSARRAEELAKQRRTWAYVTGGAGLAAAGSALGLFLINQKQYNAWQRDQAAVVGAGADHPTLAEAAQLGHQAAMIERYDNATIGLGIAAAALLSASTVLFLSSETSAKRGNAARTPTSLFTW